MSECVWAFHFLSQPLPFPFVGGGGTRKCAEVGLPVLGYSLLFPSCSFLFLFYASCSLSIPFLPFPSFALVFPSCSFFVLLCSSFFFLFLLVLSLPYLILLVHSRSFSILLDSLVPSLFLLVPCLSFLFLLFPSFPGPLSFLSATAPFHIMFSFESPRFLSPVDLPCAYLPSSLQRSHCLFAPFPSLFRRFSAETRGSSPEIAGLLFILPFSFFYVHQTTPPWSQPCPALEKKTPTPLPPLSCPSSLLGREGGRDATEQGRGDIGGW